MKKNYLLLFAIVSFAIFVSCESEDKPFLILLDEETEFSVSAEAHEYSKVFNCNTSWEATVDVTWCTVSPNQGEGNSSFIIYIQVEANPMAAERTAIITIQAGSLRKNITLIQQPGAPALSISPAFIRADGIENVYSIAVTSNAQWTAVVNDAAVNTWCTITPNSGFGNGTITVSTKRNLGYARRYAFVSVVSDGVHRTDTILQNGDEIYSDPSIAVTINGITWASRNVDNFGRFTDFSFNAGKYYQFNRPTGYSYVEGRIEPAFESGYTNEYSDWSLIYDPCPCGWRLPTNTELENLRMSGFRWINEPAGAWFGPDAQSATTIAPGKAIFLPAQGLISQGEILGAEEGWYWTKTQSTTNDDYVYVLPFNRTGSYPVLSRVYLKPNALLVRCVKE
ncbi:MAG: hypothetical protein LBI82_03715 [Dysgonamonadaceae bacterium]|jgi:hypothetical protein|nr:hypothetical protein [Dysgonamonadaceae bacterium]